MCGMWVKIIEQFRQEVEAKDATFILSLPWVYASHDEKNFSNMEDIAKKFSKIAPLVYDKNDYNLKKDSSLFADTHHHLVFEARKLRSEQLAEQLKPVINTINN